MKSFSLRSLPLIAATFALLTLVGCEKEMPDTLVTNYDASEMDQAIAKARSKVDDFLKEFEAGNGENFSVKAPISDTENTEHFWLTDIRYEDGKFTGLVGNDPGLVKNVKFGDSYTLAKDEISDWMFIREEKIHGNYTMRPLLKTMPPEEAANWRAMLADPE